MAAVRRGLVILVLAATLAGCGGGGSSATPELAGARGRTVAAGTARFSLLIDVVVGGRAVRASENGTVSFTRHRAHLYKLVPGGGLPQELVFDGPWTYANANVAAAMQDSSVRPWTKLDARRLSPAQRAARPDELAHIRALVYLSDGVATPKLIGEDTVEGEKTTRFRGVVDPARVIARAPGVASAVRNDYPAKPFSADFWLDAAGRVRRVLVAYRTAGGTPITLDGRYSEFGTKVDLGVPQADSIQDISP
jgi:hypothetical protein